MRRGRRTSRRYRGSRRGIGIVIPLLIVLCIAAAVSLYFINDNMAFTRDGAFFLSPNKEVKTSQVDANLIIEQGSEDTPEPVVPEQSNEVPDMPESDEGKRAYFIPIGSVKNTELFDAALSEIPSGINTLVLEVKAEDGTLAFVSESNIAKNAAVGGDDTTLTSAMTKARAAGYRVALYMSCFKDNEAARKNQSYSARTANKIIWLDGNNVRWLSAYSDSAQEYLISAVEKLAAMSPDEIILSNISFPAVGKTELLSYDESLGTKREMLKSFISDVKTAAGSISLSAVYENYNSNTLKSSGQNAEDFGGFDTVYVNSAAGRYTLGFDTAAQLFENAKCKLIPVSAQSTEDEYMIRK